MEIILIRHERMILHQILFALGLLIAIFSWSCTDLEPETEGELTFDRFPESEDQIIALLADAYASLTNVGSHGSFWGLQNISSDEMAIPQRGNEWLDDGNWLRLHRHEQRPSDFSVVNAWNELYSLVNQCNRTIELIEELSITAQWDQEDAQIYIAELKVLRAYAYWWLLDLFGNVPLVLDYQYPDQFPPTVSRSQVFNFVETELLENLPNLSKEKNGPLYGRFNYWAAKALLSRFYLNAEIYSSNPRWEEAAAHAGDVINSGLYSIEANYFTNFNKDNAASFENILVVPFSHSSNCCFNWHMMTLHSESYHTFQLNQSPWNGYVVMQEFYEKYSDLDLRKGIWGNQKIRGNFIAGPQYHFDGNTPLVDPQVEPSDPDGPNIVFTPSINELFPNCLRQAGVRIGKYEIRESESSRLDNDFVLLRYAEVLFNKAEAEYRMGSQAGLELVNLIRERAGLDRLEFLDYDNLLDERGRELFAEGLRRTDLIRFGKFNEPWRFKAASHPNKQLMPIPRQATNANPNLVQNPGY